MDVSGSLSLVQTVIDNLGSPIWKEIVGVLGVKTQLEKLKDTMFFINNVLLDAEEEERQLQVRGRRRSHVKRGRLERLREALYQADELFDEVTTLADSKKLITGNKLSREVCIFFSRFNQLRFAFTWSREIKTIREKLDDIVKDHQLAGIQSIVPQYSLLTNNPRETHSNVGLENYGFIGRDEAKRIVIDMIVGNSNVMENVSVVSIVGIGGLGKTTLAQHVYHDKKVREEFPLKMWVCVSDDFDVKALAGKILAAATYQANQSGSLDLEQLEKNLQQQLDGKKYLLVLDDVWNDNSEEWEKLKAMLVTGGRGSRVVVTTRSRKVAQVVGSSAKLTHALEDLSDKDCWELFEKITQPKQPQLIEIGKQIVQKCPKVPLAIRVIGSLLRGQDESKWENLKKTDLTNIIQDESNGILPVLKISYDYLPFHLKSCFSYCAIFPKDEEIIKDDLISLWMAQGFIIPSDWESFEDVGDKYFEQLLQRCFFQDIEVDKGTNEIVSCKMHDLIHDLAKEVARTDILTCDYSTRRFNEKTRHVYLDRSTPEDLLGELTKMERMRTLLCNNHGRSFSLGSLDVAVSKMKYLRVLSLRNADLEMLPSGIGELLHLRYLNLSYNNKLCVLPSSITKLFNLQTLKLRSCSGLERLPREMRKLVNLRHLDISNCKKLTHMPPGMNYMESLQKLTMFVVSGSGRSNAAWNWRSTGVGHIEDLDNFTNYTSSMHIIVKEDVRCDAMVAGGMLSKSKKLWNILYEWETEDRNNAEELLEVLQPHPNLKKVELLKYPGVRLPSWGGSLINLPNLVGIYIKDCKRLENLPLMSQLRCLKVLELKRLEEVEYIESSISNRGDDGELVFFPSLEVLVLGNMPRLKGWWKPELGKGESETQLQQAPELSYLSINDCPNLTTFPFCPKLKNLELYRYNEALAPIMREATQQEEEGLRYGRLMEVLIDNVAYLISLPIHSLHHLSRLQIEYNDNIERLDIGAVGEVFRSGRLSSLRSLVIQHCSKLKSISGRGVWEHFTALESLELRWLPELELEDEDDVIGNSSSAAEIEMLRRYLAPTLRSLILWRLPKVVKLPKGIGCLSSLRSPFIIDCESFESLTPSIGGLSSLQSLEIKYCTKLKTMPEEMRHLTSLTNLHIDCCSPEKELMQEQE